MNDTVTQNNPNTIITKQNILGVNVQFGYDYTSAIALIKETFLKDNKNHMIVTVNPEMIVSAQEDLDFKEIINNADLTVPDGIGVSMAQRYLSAINSTTPTIIKVLKGIGVGFKSILNSSNLPERITGVHLTSDILKMADEGGYSVFLLGGRVRSAFGEGIDTGVDLATEFADLVRKKYPNVHIVGSSSSFSSSVSDDMATVDFITSCMKQHKVSRLDVLLVAYNFNAQEKCISRLTKKIPVSVSMGVGATFDYMIGTMVYSPELIRNIGLEWFFRLLNQPWRYKRIFNAFPRFPWLVFKRSL